MSRIAKFARPLVSSLIESVLAEGATTWRLTPSPVSKVRATARVDPGVDRVRGEVEHERRLLA